MRAIVRSFIGEEVVFNQEHDGPEYDGVPTVSNYFLEYARAHVAAFPGGGIEMVEVEFPSMPSCRRYLHYEVDPGGVVSLMMTFKTGKKYGTWTPTMKAAIVRGFKDKQLIFLNETVVMEPHPHELMEVLKDTYASSMAAGELTMVELEFPGDPPGQQFFRIGVDLSGIIRPVEIL